MKTEMKSSLKLFVRPSLVVLGFMLAYALVHAGLSVKKDSVKISQNLEKNEMEYQNSAISHKQEANTPTIIAEENPAKDTLLPLETASQEKETKQEVKQEIKQEIQNEPKQNNAPPIQNNQKTPTTPTMGKKPLEYKVAVSSVNVRAFPSTKGKIIGSLTKDASVKVLEIQKDWAKIEFTKETKGYVFLKLLKKVE
ncbi:SH3 domain-containing protein [Helicobacter pylori]|uniref:SH3 domain-containing protein n=1 Tax=Helicobacter pylori TaxID=210 RepID=UPI000EB5CB62|nr:SH3 domain-containing protein [Helicobacter pylori]WQV00708.1 SH3 domain-containing protein [Helicobacter pylori]